MIPLRIGEIFVFNVFLNRKYDSKQLFIDNFGKDLVIWSSDIVFFGKTIKKRNMFHSYNRKLKSYHLLLECDRNHPTIAKLFASPWTCFAISLQKLRILLSLSHSLQLSHSSRIWIGPDNIAAGLTPRLAIWYMQPHYIYSIVSKFSDPFVRLNL